MYLLFSEPSSEVCALHIRPRTATVFTSSLSFSRAADCAFLLTSLSSVRPLLRSHHFPEPSLARTMFFSFRSLILSHYLLGLEGSVSELSLGMDPFLRSSLPCSQSSVFLSAVFLSLSLDYVLLHFLTFCSLLVSLSPA
jgi:hypothetical protein